MNIEVPTFENNIPVPTVIEQTNRGERAYDIYSRLLKDRIVFISHPLFGAYANVIMAQLLFLEADKPEADISLYINTYGGDPMAGLAVYDSIQYIRPEVQTICIGEARNIAALLLAAGTKGKRIALPNASISLLQPMGGIGGQASDIEIQTKENVRVKNKINEILAELTGQKIDKIKADTEREHFFTAKDAVEYGIIDKMIEARKKED